MAKSVPTNLALGAAERSVLTASVVFCNIPGLKAATATLGLRLISSLHNVLRDWTPTVGGPTVIRVLSSLTGAIVIIPDYSSVYAHHEVPNLVSRAAASGIPLSIGVAFGELDCLADADKSLNFVGQAMNLAARLAFSAENPGVLYHESYGALVHTLAEASSSAGLNPNRGKPYLIAGKDHDLHGFRCTGFKINRWGGLGAPSLGRVPPISTPVENLNGVVLSYDLPQFSRGDRSQLGKRFEGVVRAFAYCRRGSEGWLLSPGGDGGLIVMQTPKESGYELAVRFLRRLRIEGKDKSPLLGAECRIGVHYGTVAVYMNAEGTRRPTGPVCFQADDLPSDSVARKAGGIVFSAAIAEVVSGGSEQTLRDEFLELVPLTAGPAAGIARYVERRSQEQVVADPLESLVSGRANDWERET